MAFVAKVGCGQKESFQQQPEELEIFIKMHNA